MLLHMYTWQNMYFVSHSAAVGTLRQMMYSIARQKLGAHTVQNDEVWTYMKLFIVPHVFATNEKFTSDPKKWSRYITQKILYCEMLEGKANLHWTLSFAYKYLVDIEGSTMNRFLLFPQEMNKKFWIKLQDVMRTTFCLFFSNPVHLLWWTYYKPFPCASCTGEWCHLVLFF